MALPNEIHPFAIAGGGNQYQVANSLRFRKSNSASLSRTSSTSTSTTTFTASLWIKRGALNGGTAQRLMCFPDGSSAAGFNLYYDIPGDGYGTEDSIGVALTIGASSYFWNTSPVYRDPSAWYHVVVTVDTTQATSTNRVKVYVNGSLISGSWYVTPGAVPQNSSVANMNSSTWAIGRYSTTRYFDGYMAEVNFIDGQALDPTYFGQTDSITNQWVPKKYTGSYGTNGFYLPFNTSTAASYAGSFNGSSKSLTISGLTPNLSTYGNFTIEAWINISSFSPDPQFIWGSGNSTSCGYVYSTGAIGMGISGTSEFKSSAGVISTGTWYHVAWVVSGSNINIYVNGTSVASTSSASTYLSNTTNAFVIGFRGDVTYYFNGSISNFRFNNTALYTAAFAPKGVPLTAVSGTQLLTLQNATIIDNSTNAYTITNNGTVATSAATPWTNYIAGMDYSGNNNGWTSSGISVTSGTTYDVMIDSPTAYNDGGNNRGNYATLNPLTKSTTSNAPTPSEGNLNFVTPSGVNTSGWPLALGTIAVNSGSGKWYFEVDISGLETDSIIAFGWSQISIINDSDNSDQLDKIIGALIRNDSVSTGLRSAILGTYVTRDGADATDATYQIALDNTDGKIWIGKNNTWYASGNPSQGTSEIGTFTTQTLIPIIMVQKGNTTSDSSSALNFGQRPFSYTPPSGFLALNSYNLANPSLPLV